MLLLFYQEVKLADTPAEQDLLDSLGELFSIIVTIDNIEKLYLKDAISDAEYNEIVERNLKQYNTILQDEKVAKAFGSLEQFKNEWDVGEEIQCPHLSVHGSAANLYILILISRQIEAPRAIERIRVGVPSTLVQAASSSSAPAPSIGGNTSGALIAEATQDFITFLDALRLGMLAKDQLHPLLTEVIQSVNKVTDRDFEHRGKIVQWLIFLNQMKAAEELTEDKARELEMDINQAYNGFKSTLT